MTTRRTIGIAAAIVGVAISVGHILLAFVSTTPERYHGHGVIVAIGIVLALGGLLLLGSDREH